jgi:hypothetical protein
MPEPSLSQAIINSIYMNTATIDTTGDLSILSKLGLFVLRYPVLIGNDLVVDCYESSTSTVGRMMCFTRY